MKKKTYSKNAARLTIVCPIKTKTKIQRLAASQNKTPSHFILNLVEEFEIHHTDRIPNDKTIESIKATKKGIGVQEHKSLEDLYDDLGI